MTIAAITMIQDVVSRLHADEARPADVAAFFGEPTDPIGDGTQLHVRPADGPASVVMVMGRYDEDDVDYVRIELAEDSRFALRALQEVFGTGTTNELMFDTDPEGVWFELPGPRPNLVVLTAEVSKTLSEPLERGRVRALTLRRDRAS